MKTVKCFAAISPEFKGEVMASCIRYVMFNGNSFRTSHILIQLIGDNEEKYQHYPMSKVYKKVAPHIKNFCKLGIIEITGQDSSKDSLGRTVHSNLYSFKQEYL